MYGTVHTVVTKTKSGCTESETESRMSTAKPYNDSKL